MVHAAIFNEKSKIPFSYMLYVYSVKEPIGELNLKRALDEDTGVFSSFFSLLLSSSPLGQTDNVLHLAIKTTVGYSYVHVQ